MARIQEPPRDFGRLSLVTVEIDPGVLLRVTWADPAHRLSFSRRARYRFDAPAGEYGTLYAAFDFTTAFAETILRNNPRRQPAGGAVILDYKALEQRRVIQLAAGVEQRPLRLIKLYDDGLAAAHSDNQIAARDHYPTTQRWSHAFHGHPIGADGIVYMSRYMGSTRSVALFDRAKDAVSEADSTPLLAHPDLPDTLERFEIGIDTP